MKLNIIKTFNFAHHGYDVREYVEGEEIETDDEALIRVATTEGWAEPVGGESKAKPAAPENKAKKA